MRHAACESCRQKGAITPQRSAKRVMRLYVVHLSVRDLCGSGPHTVRWKSWELIARTISLTPSLYVAQRQSTYSQKNMDKFGGD